MLVLEAVYVLVVVVLVGTVLVVEGLPLAALVIVLRLDATPVKVEGTQGIVEVIVAPDIVLVDVYDVTRAATVEVEAGIVAVTILVVDVGLICKSELQ